MNNIKRISAGVVFESDVLEFIDQMATSQQRKRSFIINQIIRYYARSLQHQQTSSQQSAEPQPKSEVLTSINF